MYVRREGQWESYIPHPPRGHKHPIVFKGLWMSCCYGRCVIHEECVQVTYLKSCILCCAEWCVWDAHVLVLAGDG
jgi:hypothetical protein